MSIPYKVDVQCRGALRTFIRNTELCVQQTQQRTPRYGRRTSWERETPTSADLYAFSKPRLDRQVWADNPPSSVHLLTRSVFKRINRALKAGRQSGRGHALLVTAGVTRKQRHDHWHVCQAELLNALIETLLNDVYVVSQHPWVISLVDSLEEKTSRIVLLFCFSSLRLIKGATWWKRLSNSNADIHKTPSFFCSTWGKQVL